MLLLALAAAFAGRSATAQTPPSDPPADGRTPLVEIPVGCQIQPLPDVVFVGTVVASDYRTARFRVDQSRAGNVTSFGAGDLVDVRYGIDTKYLREGRQYLIAAVYDQQISGLRSRVKPEESIYGGDEIIGATESELECPAIVDPMRTIHVDGSSVDSGLLRPMVDDRNGLLRVLVVPIVVVIGAVFALALARWILTGFGRGVESWATASERNRAARQAPRRRRPVPAGAGGPAPAAPPRTPAQRAVERVQQRSLEQGALPRRQPPRGRGRRDR
jgi:hypothetical protein